RGDLMRILAQTAAFITSPVGAAALAAGLEIGFGDDAGERRALWDGRAIDFAPVFERARERGEIDDRFDDEAVLAMTAGAVYHRVLAMGRHVDDAWISRVVGQVAVVRPATCL
ncbi:MAG TPA: TetR-like C-terminal domain-containing protein, partial [Ilumatobacteraceae bacterium]|nr:TetR-like C-terminal domain-containing protein [Ilumatobacteraceae bacterium]